MHYVAILGSTGSVGTQALEVIAANRDKFSVTALAAFHNDELLERQIEAFKPQIAVLVDKQAADRLCRRYQGSTLILTGEEGLLAAATQAQTQTVLTSLVGFAGLRPTIAAIEAGKHIALANKETLVAAGELVMALARKHNVHIIPVDSEHSALLQCLQGERRQRIERLILTASGGPFRGWTKDRLADVTVEQCLCHPNWSMGKKITIDSATLVNKGLEVIEARWLFGVDYDHIDVAIHPQSIVHSMIEYVDGSIMAQMAMPDMRVPIQYALTYPDRSPAAFPKLDFKTIPALTFEQPDTKTFPGLALAYQAGRIGGTMPCVFNSANEIAVYAFLAGKIKFLEISEIIKYTMDSHQVQTANDFSVLFAADMWARNHASELIK